MAELEIHHEEEPAKDPFGRRVGLLAAFMAVALALVSITSHRTHTEAIMKQAAGNDAWAHYQSTRVKYHNLELGENLVSVFGAKNELAERALAAYAAQKKDYEARAKAIEAQAEAADHAAEAAEHRGLRYDIGEGLLEIGVVLTSLYFISRKRLFPAVGVAAGAAGVVIALTGALM